MHAFQLSPKSSFCERNTPAFSRMARVLTTAGLFFLALILAGCSQDLPTSETPETVHPTPALQASPTASPPPDEGETPTSIPAIDVPLESLAGLEIDFWHVWTGTPGDYLAAQAAAFNAENNTGITVRAFQVDDLESRLRAALDSGSPPALSVGFNYHALSWDRSGTALADLTPYFFDPLVGFDAGERSDFYSDFLQADTVGEKLLSLPLHRSAELLFYNASWGQELGFDRPPSTLQDLQAQACAAATAVHTDGDPSNDQQGGLVLTYEPGALLSWIYAFGGGLPPVEGGGVYGLERPETEAAFEFLRALIDEGCAWVAEERFPNGAFAERRGLFLQSTLGGLTFQQAAMEAAENHDTWQLLPYPSVSGRPSSLVSGPGFVIFSGTLEDQLAAWMFVRWFMAPERLAGWVELTSSFPPRASALEELGESASQAPEWGEAESIILSAGEPIPAIRSWSAARWVLEDSARMLYAPLTRPEDIPAIVLELDNLTEEVAGFFR